MIYLYTERTKRIHTRICRKGITFSHISETQLLNKKLCKICQKKISNKKLHFFKKKGVQVYNIVYKYKKSAKNIKPKKGINNNTIIYNSAKCVKCNFMTIGISRELHKKYLCISCFLEKEKLDLLQKNYKYCEKIIHKGPFRKPSSPRSMLLA